MPINELSLEALPAWCRLNDVTFYDVKAASVDGRGTGIVADSALSAAQETVDGTTLMRVPNNLILSTELVKEYAKEDKTFRELLTAVGLKSDRENILLFLLVQIAISSEGHHKGTGISNPWTIYVRLLPSNPPIPTLWSGPEMALLKGTSLEPALSAKLSALSKEFEALKDSSSDIFSWFELLWEQGTVSLKDWVLVDALFRSRCLELKHGQSAMVPCIDLANHSSRNPTGRYYTNSKDEIVLSLRGGCTVAEGDEITIDYGDKSAAEMLFSYGFIDPDSPVDGLVLPLTALPDDPLATAKLYSFSKTPTVSVSRKGQDSIQWSSPFAYLACLNEEDGLQFRVLQETSGSQHFKVFWGDMDVTEKTDEFEILIQNHELCDVFKLRAVSVVLDRVQSQLTCLALAEGVSVSIDGLEDNPVPALVREECARAASELRARETRLLERALEVLSEERSQLLASKNVVAYLGSMETTQNEDPPEEASNDGAGFS